MAVKRLPRDAWYIETSSELLASVPEESCLLLRQFEPNSSILPVPQAVLLAFIWLSHARCVSADEIAAHLASSHLALTGLPANNLLDNVVLPAIWTFDGSRFPLRAYCEPLKLFMDLLWFYVGSQPGPESAVRERLAAHWMMQSRHVQDAVLDARRLSASRLLRNLSVRSSAKLFGPRLAKQIESAEVQRYVDKQLERLPPSIASRQYLRPLATLARKCEIAANLQKLGMFTRSELRLLETTRGSLREAIGAISPEEARLINPLDTDAHFVEEFLDEPMHLHRVDGHSLTDLPDVVRGEQVIPVWLLDYVFSIGGRNRTRSVGAIPHWFVSAESLRSIGPLAFGMPRVDDGGIYPLLRIDDDERNPLLTEMMYGFESAEGLYDLLLLGATGYVRVDIAGIDSAGELHLIYSGWHRLPADIRNAVVKTATNAVGARYGFDARAARAKLRRDLVQEWSGATHHLAFIAADASKAEDLVLEQETLVDTVSETDASSWTEYCRARRSLLVEQQERVRMLEAGQSYGPDDFSNLEHATWKVLQQRDSVPSLVLGGLSSSDSRGYAEAVNHLLKSSDRCFIHLNYHNTRLELSWARPVGDTTEYGRIDASDVELTKLEVLAGEWLTATDDEHADSNALREIARELRQQLHHVAEPIREVLVPKGVRHLIVSPNAFLQCLPLHTPGVDSDAQLLGDAFLHVSYAPSVRVLANLGRMRREPGDSALIVGAAPKNDLPYVGYESTALRSLFPRTSVLVGTDATPARVLLASSSAGLIHYACHGKHFPDDFYRSGLQLAGDPPSEGWLSAAQILNLGDFRRAELVVLGACETGRSRTWLHTIQNYFALDGAFLAKGARAVISTLWPIDDFGGFLFSANFYQLLLDGMTVQDAYDDAIAFFRMGANADTLPTYTRVTLSDVFPKWRTELEARSADLADPIFWTAFKCSGISWQPHPLGTLR